MSRSILKKLNFVNVSCALSIAAFSIVSDAQTAAPIKAPTIQKPQVIVPSRPAVNPPTGAPATATGFPANAVAIPFNETAFKSAADSGATVVLLFSSPTDLIWESQNEALKLVLRDAELAKLARFQIDMANSQLTERFAVKVAGTILIFKGGQERIRSNRMTKPDVLRKMLLLHSVL